MRTSIFCLVILLLSCSLLWSQNQAIEFYYYNSDLVRLNEQNFQYSLKPYYNTTLSIQGLNSIENRLNFNRESKRSRFQVKLDKHYRWLSHSVESGYLSLFDKSDLDPSQTPYTNKTGFYGYGIGVYPIDSLTIYSDAKYYFRKEQDRINLEQTNTNDGYSYQVGGYFSSKVNSFDISANAMYEEKSLDRDQYDLGRVGFNVVHYSNSYDMLLNLNAQSKSDNLYILRPDTTASRSYINNDTINQNQVNTTLDIRFYPTQNLYVNLSERYSQQKNRRRKEVVNDNADFNNDISLSLRYSIRSNLWWDSQIRNVFAIKDYSYTKNSNTTDSKSIDNRLSWEYSFGDSLITGFNIDMTRSKFPDAQNRRDRDLRKQISRIGWTHYYHERLRFNTWFVWNLEDDISINALNSSNNKRINIISLVPECSILFGDRILFRQNYVIRADYTDYVYESSGYLDNLYRQISLKYSLLFDDYPFIARSNDPVWLQLPYRNHTGNAFSTEFSFQFEQHEFGYRKSGNDYYSIQTPKNIKYIAQWIVKYDIQDIYLYLQPKYSWGTWKEYSAILGLAGQFNQNSFFEVSLNPIGEDYSSIDWRFSMNLSLQF